MAESETESVPSKDQIRILIADFIESNEMIRHVENERWKITEFYFAIMIGIFTIISALGRDFSEIAEKIGPVLASLLVISTCIILTMFAKLRIEFIERMENLTRTRSAFKLSKKWNSYVQKPIPKFGKVNSVHMMCNFLIIVATSIVTGALFGQSWKQENTASLPFIALVFLGLLIWLTVLYRCWGPIEALKSN
ncbi:MAG: hypothetical protein QXQ94_11390 [Candidatus Bathyarchaeia archaeon]